MDMNYCSKVKDSLNYIEKNLDNKITLDALANKAHLSKYHYHRLFCKMVGVSVNKYINQRRMEKAAEELILTDQPIMDIALKYQYSSQEAFARAFRRCHSVTPGKYRRMYTGCHSNVSNTFVYFKQIMNIAA